MNRLVLLFLLLSGHSLTQVYICGNVENLCLPGDSYKTTRYVKSLDSSEALFIFGSVESVFNLNQIDSLADYIIKGKNVYIGADNWPLCSESNLLTKRLYNNEFYGEYNEMVAEPTSNRGVLNWSQHDVIPAGQSTSAFPIQPGLSVEAWVKDQPIILAGTYGLGRIIIDGGYSRFYCQQISTNCEKLFLTFLEYLVKK